MACMVLPLLDEGRKRLYSHGTWNLPVPPPPPGTSADMRERAGVGGMSLFASLTAVHSACSGSFVHDVTGASGIFGKASDALSLFRDD